MILTAEKPELSEVVYPKLLGLQSEPTGAKTRDFIYLH